MTSRLKTCILALMIGVSSACSSGPSPQLAAPTIETAFNDLPYQRLRRETIAYGERHPLAVFKDASQVSRFDVLTAGMEHSGGNRYPIIRRRSLRYLDVRDQVADSRTCPQVEQVLERLASLAVPRMHLPDWTRGPSPTTFSGPADWTGSIYRLKTTARFPDLAPASMEYSGDAALEVWFAQTIQALRPCWGEGPPDDPAPAE